MFSDYPISSGAEPLLSEYETLSREELKKRLQVFITGLLTHDFEKLCNMIYRHDVNEEKFNQALLHGNLNEQAGRIADLVIEREMQKVQTRRAYRKFKDEQKKKNIEK